MPKALIGAARTAGQELQTRANEALQELVSEYLTDRENGATLEYLFGLTKNGENLEENVQEDFFRYWVSVAPLRYHDRLYKLWRLSKRASDEE